MGQDHGVDEDEDEVEKEGPPPDDGCDPVPGLGHEDDLEVHDGEDGGVQRGSDNQQTVGLTVRIPRGQACDRKRL